MTTRLAPPPPAGSPVLQAYDQCVDGLFTYCLSVLCQHDAAVAAVREVRDLALRHGERLAEPGLLRAWLYALARYGCLRRLEHGPGPQRPPAEQFTVLPGAAALPGAATRPALAAQRRRELASLAWPEAAGTAPEQREALELAVRHRLRPAEVAAVLGLPAAAADGLLAAAAAEVARTRAALLLLGTGGCPVLAQLGGPGAAARPDRVLGPALRRELVQHVGDCPTCREAADRSAAGPGAGLAALPELPVLTAPVTLRVGSLPGRPAYGAAGAAFLAGAAAGRRALRAESAPGELRFDRSGFPRHRAPGQGRASAGRQRMVTTGVLAAVLAAPVVALWGAHHGGDRGAGSVSAVRVDTAELPVPDDGPEARPASGARTGAGGLQLAAVRGAETLLPPIAGAAVPVPSGSSARLDGPGLVAAPVGTAQPPAPGAALAPAPVPAQLTVEAQEFSGRTVITLTDSGGTALQWHAVLDADWLRLSRDSGTLAPGQRITITVTVDEDRAPQTRWTARIAFPPSEAVVTLEGGPEHRGGSPTPTPTQTASTAPPPGTPTPSPTPSASSPSPSATPPAASPTPAPTASASPSR
ncbi:BACON domain-containing protein [Saccharothrix sp. ST-888]|uniref:BACON domain-containing protein n=1 Tax=Saccharothrix sp. ST-888 TaxID=1427391 RepID=UPI0005EC65FF|nr:hypothetical protein [Saccharothrix sp. ST-888]